MEKQGSYFGKSGWKVSSHKMVGCGFLMMSFSLLSEVKMSTVTCLCLDGCSKDV